MAEKLLKYFNDAENLGRIKAKMRLAILTNMPSSKAAVEPDSPENINKFEKAMQEVRKEFK
jgi:hypothetical protein